MKIITQSTALICLALSAFSAGAARPSVEWSTLGNTTDSNGKPIYTQRFVINPINGVKRICFNQFDRKMHTVNPADTIGEIVPGYYYIASPRFAQASPVVVDVVTSGTLRNASYLPDGFHAVMADGSVQPVNASVGSIFNSKEQWSLPGSDRNPSAESIFDLNESLRAAQAPGPLDIIPSLKSAVITAPGKAPELSTIRFKAVEHPNPEYYRIDLSGDSITIDYASHKASKLAETTLLQLLAQNPDGLPKAVITDYPDYPYRAVMIDIARNFLNIAELQTIAQHLAHYKMNTLHFHFADDEAWRLEIPGLPELTNVGGRRGYSLDSADFLPQIFTGDGNPDNPNGTSNGYITRSEFVDFLRYCNSLGIDVIPEVESPGHARAAIYAMENRYRHTGDDSLRLIEDGDTSTYSSAQAFHDNVMNPALEGPYRFLDKVTTEIKAMYDEAGVPLKAFHIGGDEVADGAWNGAPSVNALKQREGISTQSQVHQIFVERITKMLASKQIPMMGWMEVALDHSPEFNSQMAPLTAGVYFWKTTRTSRAAEAAANGFPVVICNVDHFYLDQTYNNHPCELGLTWGGCVDEFATLNGYLPSMCPVDSTLADKVIGASGQIFAETIRNFPQVQTYLFPKALGLAERTWNADTTYTDAQFSRLIGSRELPALARRGVDFHLRQPGIKVVDNKVHINSPYPEATISYSVNGAEAIPYTEPLDTVSLPKGAEIRATLHYLGHASYPTRIELE